MSKLKTQAEAAFNELYPQEAKQMEAVQTIKNEQEGPINAPTAIVAQRTVTPMELLQLAMSRGANIDAMEKLMELQLRWEANEAKKAFVAAMNEFKKNPPEIIKNKRVAYKEVAYRHATLDSVCDAIQEGLSKVGISHRWSVAQTDGLIRVSCILTHELGHSEETVLTALPDATGSKNAIQAIASTTTYLSRYTLLMGTGLAAADMDNDGQGAPKWEKLQEYLDAIATSPNLQDLERNFKGGVKEAMAIPNTQAVLTLTAAKDAKKRALMAEEPA